jgi:tetratricopeptide (TPR) repeat protein
MLILDGRRVGAVALATLVCTLLGGTALAQLNPAQKALEEQGRYWEDRHQPDRAAVAWQKLLESDADNAEALLHLGIIEARAGHLDKARGYAAKLKTAHPNGPEVAVLDRAIAVGVVPPGAVDEARKLARAGQYDEAIAAYRKALKGQPPTPDLAREYYETLAGTKAGWAEARKGLQEMAAALPRDPSVQYGYARVLTYHEDTRRQGIAMLASLSGDASVGKQANTAWHDALVWLSAKPADIPLYKNYMASHSGDTALGKKLADLQNPSSPVNANGGDLPHTKALAAMNAGHLNEAAQMYQAILQKNPKDVDALGGLGVVREREGNLHEAHQLLDRAVSLAPSSDTQWKEALASTVYLETVADAKAALKVRKWKLAEDKAREAMAHPIKGDVNAELTLAEVYQHTKHLADAEKIFRTVLHEQPNNREAAAGLASVMLVTGRSHEAEHVARTKQARAPRGEVQAADLARVEAINLAQEARVAVNRGDHKGAMTDFQQAIARDPANPWIKLDYARLLVRHGDRAGADRVIAILVSGPHPSGDALAAAAIWYGERGDYDNAAKYAAMVPPSTRVGEFASMEQQWAAERDAHNAVAAARQGHVAEAHRTLDDIVARAHGNIGVVGVAADAYVDIGDAQQAVAVMRGAMGPNASLDAQIQYAGVLLRVSALDELTTVMHRVDTQSTNFNPKQQARAADLHRGLSIKLADRSRLHGDYAGAYDRLAPELAVSRDATVLAALARIYDSAGRHEDAVEIYNRILRADPSNMDARREIIGAAIVVGDYRRADALLQEGLQRTPNDPRLHLLAAGLARAEGDDEKALAELATAQAELKQRNGNAWFAPDHSGSYAALTYNPGSNPFAESEPYPTLGRPAMADPYYYSSYSAMPSYGTNPAYPVPEMGAPVIIAGATSEDQQLAQQIAEEMEQVSDPLRPYIEGGVSFRNIEGEQALSQFALVSLPVSGGMRIGPGMLTLQVEPTAAYSGSLNNVDPGVFRRFGTNATLPSGATGAPGYSGDVQGIGFAVGYTTANVSAAIGMTPHGDFPVSNVVGHVVWAMPLNSVTSVKVSAFRDPVLDSMLAYAGIRDPLSGRSWGGVTRNGGRLDIGYDNGRMGVYGDATGAYLEGDHVRSNWMVDAGGGVYWRFFRTEYGALKVGVNLQGQAYERNLDFYTLGQGGYFSPQEAVEATIPVEYSGRWDRLSYSVGGQVGFMNFHESNSPYFPLDPNLQALSNPYSYYPSQTVTTAIYGFTAKAEYPVAPLLVLGASFSADNSHNYNEQSLMVYVKKKFDLFY